MCMLILILHHHLLLELLHLLVVIIILEVLEQILVRAQLLVKSLIIFTKNYRYI